MDEGTLDLKTGVFCPQASFAKANGIAGRDGITREKKDRPMGQENVFLQIHNMEQ